MQTYANQKKAANQAKANFKASPANQGYIDIPGFTDISIVPWFRRYLGWFSVIVFIPLPICWGNCFNWGYLYGWLLSRLLR